MGEIFADDRVEKDFGGFINILMRFAFGQRSAGYAGERIEAEKAVAAFEYFACACAHRLNGIVAEMFGETRAPKKMHAVPRLQGRFGTARAAAAHQSHMAAMGMGERFHDGAGFAVRTHRQDDGVVRPFHAKLLAISAFREEPCAPCFIARLPPQPSFWPSRRLAAPVMIPGRRWRTTPGKPAPRRS